MSADPYLLACFALLCLAAGGLLGTWRSTRPKEVDRARSIVISDYPVGADDLVVLVFEGMLSNVQRSHLAEAWRAGVASGGPIVLGGGVQVTILRGLARNIRKNGGAE